MTQRSPISSFSRVVRTAAFASLVMCSSFSICAAQSVSTPATVDKLKQPVHISADKATLETIAAQLSQQTGLRIEAAPYLREHRTTVQFDGDSAVTLIATLAELNGWQWQEERDGRIVISRALGRKPQNIGEVPAAIQRTMAKDLRRYLHIGKEVNAEEVKPLAVLPHPESPLTEAYYRTEAEKNAVRANVNARIASGTAYSVNILTETLKQTAPEYKPVKYARLTNWQRLMLCAKHIFMHLKILTIPETFEVTYDCLQPYYVDVSKLEVYFPARNTIGFDLTTIENGEPIAIGIAGDIDPDWLPR